MSEVWRYFCMQICSSFGPFHTLVLFLVFSFILFKISSLEISITLYQRSWKTAIKQMKHDIYSLTLSQKLEMDGISDTHCNFSAPKLWAYCLTSIILNSKHETFVGNGKFVSYFHLKVSVCCSLKVLYIRITKQNLSCSLQFFMSTSQDDWC